MRSSVAWIILIFTTVLYAANVAAKDYQPGNYPRFSFSQLFTTGESVSEKPNIVLNAIEDGTSVDLKFNSSLISDKQYLFPANNFGSSYNVDKLVSQAFIRVMSDLVSEFACAEYRFRKRLPASHMCNGNAIDKNKREGMPFVSGQFVSNRLENHLDDRKNGVSFTAYLKSADESPLSSAFGSAHELGTFFGGFAHRRSIILSVNLEAYWWSADSQRTGKINKKPEVYFLVLPRAVDIANQKNQTSAAKYALDNARILVIGKK
mgnify:CR=1 FL=1